MKTLRARSHLTGAAPFGDGHLAVVGCSESMGSRAASARRDKVLTFVLRDMLAIMNPRSGEVNRALGSRSETTWSTPRVPRLRIWDRLIARSLLVAWTPCPPLGRSEILALRCSNVTSPNLRRCWSARGTLVGGADIDADNGLSPRYCYALSAGVGSTGFASTASATSVSSSISPLTVLFPLFNHTIFPSIAIPDPSR